MDRRVVAGIVGVVLAGIARPGHAQVAPDPSGMPPVGLSPVPSLGDTINGSSRFPGTATPSRSNRPTDPRASGPTAALPGFPESSDPVSITTEPTLHQAIRSGYRTGPIGSRLRGLRSPTGQPNTTTGRPVAPPARLSATRSAAASAPSQRGEPSPSPVPLPEMPPMESAAVPSTAEGRPSPFADQAPEVPRPQVERSSSTGLGRRPAPLSTEELRTARPRSASARTPSYRPADTPAPTPPEVTPDPVPALTLPAPEPLAVPNGPDAPPAFEPSTPAAPLPLNPPPLGPTTATVAPPTADSAVLRVSEESTALRLKPETPRELPFATLRAAAVGDEVITIEELNAVVKQRMEEMGANGPMSDQEKRQVVNMIASQALDHMIDQAVILQEAKREMRAPKAQLLFNEYVDKTWRDDELPPLLRKTSSANEYELKRKLAEQGKSYEELKEAFRKKMLARDYMSAKIHAKVSCDLAEQRAYYNAHLQDYDQPARFTWREVEISFAKNPNRAEARAKANSVLARLLRDEEFAEIAKALSDGPTATRGGIYPDMTPGSYGIPVVNDELNRLPVGQVSKVLEAPNGYHIVRVEARREAGPLRFDEVQDKIKPLVMQQNYQRAVENYLNKLRARTLIRTMFDNSESDPRLARGNDPSVQPAANR